MEAIEQELKKSLENDKKKAEDNGLHVPTKGWQEMVIEYSDLLQSVFGSVAGNAFSAVLFFYFPSLNATPTGSIPFENLAIITIVTLVVCLWLVVSTPTKVTSKGVPSAIPDTSPNTGPNASPPPPPPTLPPPPPPLLPPPPLRRAFSAALPSLVHGVEVPDDETEEEKAKREAAEAVNRDEKEKVFLNGALSFLVLGGWTSVVRNSFAWFAKLVEIVVGEGSTADLVAVVLYAPMFTLLAFNASEFVMQRMADLGQVEKPKAAQAAAVAAAKEAKADDRVAERDLEAEKLARRKLITDTSMIALVFGGKFKLAAELMDFKLENGGVKIVADFLEGAAVFVLSRMWSDLLSAYLFGMHAIPYCGGFVATLCATEASSSEQFLYAAYAVPVAWLLKHLAESSGLTSLPGMFDDIPMIFKYIVGWAFGNAFQQLLIEVKTDNPGLCNADGSCTLVNVGFSVAITVFSGIVVLLLKPYADTIEWGDGKCTNWMEDLFEDILQMVIRGAEVVSMVLWYYTAYELTHTQYTVGFQGHMDLFWAFTMTFVGSLFMVLLETMEQSVKKIKARELVSPDAPHWADAVVLFSDMVQTAFGYVAGCAWSDYLYQAAAVLNKNPTWDVILSNLAIVVLISVLSCYWLIMNASSDGLEESLTMTEDEKRAKAEAKATDRGEVEKAFFAGTLGFFVLGGWLTVVRNLFAPFQLLVEQGVLFLDEAAGLSLPAKTGDTVAVLLFAPVFTLVLFKVAGDVMTKLSKKAGVKPPKGNAAATAKVKRSSVDGGARYSANYQEKELV